MTLEHRAAQARQELFGRYDQLDALWLQAEEHLTRRHVPGAVQMMYSSCDPRSPEYKGGPEGLALSLQKRDGQWRICHGVYWFANQSEVDWIPITECSAEIRVSAAKHLPKLEQAVIESAENFILHADEAIRALTEALDRPDDRADLLAVSN